MHGPQALALAIHDGDGGGGSLLRNPVAQRRIDAIAAHRERGAKASLGGAGLFDLTRHLIHLAALSMRRHTLAQAPEHFAQQTACTRLQGA